MKFNFFQLFVAAFLFIKLLYSVFMVVLNYIDYKIEKKTKAYIFALFIFGKSLFNRNISVFENLNIL